MTLPVLSTLAGVTSSILRISSQRAQQKAAAAANEYQAQELREKARAAQAQANLEEAEIRQRNQRAQARQRAQLAQSGVLNSPTGQAVLNQAEDEAELEALTRRRQGNISAQGLLSEANLQDHQAARRKAKASSDLAQGLVGSGVGLMTAAEAISNKAGLKGR